MRKKLLNFILLFTCFNMFHAQADETSSFNIVSSKKESYFEISEIFQLLSNLAQNNPRFSLQEIKENVKFKMVAEGYSSDAALAFPEQLHFLARNISSIISNLDSLQDSTLKNDLLGFGIHGDMGGYDLLKEVSNRNSDRIIQNLICNDQLTLEQNDLIQSITFQPGHFSMSGHHKNTLPIFSSCILRQLGLLPHGHNSDRSFNKKTIGLDNNIFFFPMSYNIKGSARYGDHPTFLKQDYAKSKAWLSPTTMDPKHLWIWMDEKTTLLVQANPEGENNDEYFLKAKQRLANYIFTFDDFIRTTQHLLKCYFEILLKENPGEFSKQIEELRTRKNVNNIVRAAWSATGLPEQTGFELKIPVAVPRENIF